MAAQSSFQQLEPLLNLKWYQPREWNEGGEGDKIITSTTKSTKALWINQVQLYKSVCEYVGLYRSSLFLYHGSQSYHLQRAIVDR